MKTLLTALLFLSMLGARGHSADSSPAPAPLLDYLLIVTGEELLRGMYPDGHTAFITRTLLPIGGHCVGAFLVDDRAEDIQAALRFATNKARLVIVTGGLGPTVNDVTRGALSDFTGIALHEHPEALAELERRFNTPREQLRPNLRRQTLVPVRGAYLKNPHGSAVGLVFEPGETAIVALPGPPRELQPMVTNELLPYLRRKFGARPVGATLTLRFVGIGQSAIDQALREKCAVPSDMIETSLFEGGRVDFTFSLPGNTPADRARLIDLEARIRTHLGDFFYADDGVSLEEHVCRLLQGRQARLVVAEVASGGHLVASLNRAPTAARIVAGAYVAPTEDALRQLLGMTDDPWANTPPGHERVRALGRAARQLTRSDWAIVVGPVNGGGSGSFAWVVFGLPEDRWETHRLPVQGSSETAHANLTTQILDRLRRTLK
jgi:nicotinamide-nucleotide amidase